MTFLDMFVIYILAHGFVLMLKLAISELKLRKAKKGR